MARSKTVKAEPELDDTLANSLDAPSVFETESVEDVIGKEEEVVIDSRYGPPMWHESWSDWVLRQFKADELDPKGLPVVAGLRRVARAVLGPITFSGPLQSTHVGFANIDPDRYTMLAPVVCYYGIKIVWQRPEEGTTPFEVEFREVADVLTGNMERKFLRFPSASAATRAEARCLRKALQLKVISSEEATDISDEDTDVDGYIKLSSVLFMEAICSRPGVDIDLAKFVNSGEFKYDNIHNIPVKKAEAMLELLNKWQGNPSLIPANLKGYKKSWKVQLGYEKG